MAVQTGWLMSMPNCRSVSVRRQTITIVAERLHWRSNWRIGAPDISKKPAVSDGF